MGRFKAVDAAWRVLKNLSLSLDIQISTAVSISSRHLYALIFTAIEKPFSSGQRYFDLSPAAVVEIDLCGNYRVPFFFSFLIQSQYLLSIINNLLFLLGRFQKFPENTD
jgi:hypothetical protein